MALVVNAIYAIGLLYMLLVSLAGIEMCYAICSTIIA